MRYTGSNFQSEAGSAVQSAGIAGIRREVTAYAVDNEYPAPADCHKTGSFRSNSSLRSPVLQEKGNPYPRKKSERYHPKHSILKIDNAFNDKLANLGMELKNPDGKKELLLVVDDEPTVLALSVLMLTESGYKILAFEHPMKALKAYRELKDYIALVLLDFAMPDMDGEKLYDELKHSNPNVTALLISGYADHDRLQSMMSKGLDGYLGKPYTPSKLYEKVESLLR